MRLSIDGDIPSTAVNGLGTDDVTTLSASNVSNAEVLSSKRISNSNDHDGISISL
jgi:hypothetical protein